MKIAVGLLIFGHGLIHLIGFLKAFAIAKFDVINQPISKNMGLLWLLAFLLFSIVAGKLIASIGNWWVISFGALLVSQILIVNYWADAKYGTIINLVILAITFFGYANQRFMQTIAQERIELLNTAQTTKGGVVTKTDVASLPFAVQTWLANSGVVGSSRVSTVFLKQDLLLKLEPDQSEWYKGVAEQYFSIDPPAFNWTSTVDMNAMLNVVARDKFTEGKGEMQIKLLALLPVADAKNDKKIDQATLQRYLAEIVWFPSAALSPYIQWENIDEHSARATMEFKGTKGTGVFHFDENGLFEKFVALRYKDARDELPTEWMVTAINTEEINGVKIPVHCKASWTLDTMQWTWLNLRITNIQYNVENTNSLI